MSPPETTGDTLAATIDDLAEWFSTYVYTRTPHAYIILALWVVHTHTIEMVSTTPRIQVTSPQPGCGKTTLMEHLHRLVMNSEMGSHATPPLICRIVNIQQTTLLLDETDNLMNPKKEGVGDLTALLNAGYRKGQPQARLVQKSKNDANTDGDGWAVVRHKTYAAVALAGIGHHLPEALTSRCIQIELDRAREGQVTETDWDECEIAAWALRDRIAAHADAIADDFSKPKPEVPGLHGRPREVWMPLLQLANIAGPDTYTKALAAYQHLTSVEEVAAGLRPKRQEEQILSDLEQVYDQAKKPTGDTFITTDDLLTQLRCLTPETWGEEARFGPLKSKRLAMLLSEYGVHPTRNRARTQRGYLWADLTDAFIQYLPGKASKASEASELNTHEHGPDGLDGLDGLDTSPEDPPSPVQVTDDWAEWRAELDEEPTT